MKLGFAVALSLLAFSVVGTAQTSGSGQYKIKAPMPASAKHHAVALPSTKNTSGSNLQKIEQEKPHGSVAGTKNSAQRVKMMREPSNPRMDFNRSTDGKQAGLTHQPNPYQGRMKEKGQYQQH